MSTIVNLELVDEKEGKFGLADINENASARWQNVRDGQLVNIHSSLTVI